MVLTAMLNSPESGRRGRARSRHAAFTDPTSLENLRLLGHPRVLPDPKTYPAPNWSPTPRPLLLRRAHRRNHSPRTSACRLSKKLNPDALPRLPAGSGGFLLVRGPALRRRNIHNGIPPKTEI
jgi:hypothetical protein